MNVVTPTWVGAQLLATNVQKAINFQRHCNEHFNLEGCINQDFLKWCNF